MAFGGPSGVGKSSILNMLQDEEDLVVGETSKKLKRGKHTTRDSKFIPSNCGGYVIDTPGFSSIELPPIKDFAELISMFKEFTLPDDSHCKFLNCHHISEPGCLIKNMVEDNKISKTRYDFYKSMFKEFTLPDDSHCKFLNCHHISEPGCLIKNMVEDNKISKTRYDFYKKVYEKLKVERWNNYEKY